MNKRLLTGLLAFVCVTQVMPNMAMDFGRHGTNSFRVGCVGAAVSFIGSLMYSYLKSAPEEQDAQSIRQHRVKVLKRALKWTAGGFLTSAAAGFGLSMAPVTTCATAGAYAGAKIGAEYHKDVHANFPVESDCRKYLTPLNTAPQPSHNINSTMCSRGSLMDRYALTGAAFCGGLAAYVMHKYAQV